MKINLDLPLMPSEVAYAINACTKDLSNLKVNICNICTDSRECGAGDLFFAINNGALYLSDAKNKGALTVADSSYSADFKVSSVLDALLSLSSFYKSKLSSLKTTIAITGSVGKTTTKDILCSILSHRYSVHGTYKNFNNEIGLPLSILSAPKETEILVLELGMNHLGEIGRLSKAIAPDLAIITNVGSAHIGNLGSREMIAKAKLEVTEGMKSVHIIIPYEEELLRGNFNSTTFAINNIEADYSAINLKTTDKGFTFDLKMPSECIENIDIKLPGEHLINALLSAVVIARNLGFSENDIKASISNIDGTLLRQRTIKIGHFEVYDDTYSSSPEAVIANLKMIALRYKKKSCVLGDMLELGERSEELHRRIGRIAAELGYNKIYAFGKYANYVKDGAVLAKMPPDKIFIFWDTDAIDLPAEVILRNSTNGEIIIFKASHDLHIDRIYKKIQKITENENA